jgi:hypothetical protein
MGYGLWLTWKNAPATVSVIMCFRYRRYDRPLLRNRYYRTLPIRELTTVATYDMHGLGGGLSDQTTKGGGNSTGAAQLGVPLACRPLWLNWWISNLRPANDHPPLHIGTAVAFLPVTLNSGIITCMSSSHAVYGIMASPPPPSFGSSPKPQTGPMCSPVAANLS